MDEVILDGFDGIYLDWVEAFIHPPVVMLAQEQGLNPADEMVVFIEEMRAYAAARVPNFVIGKLLGQGQASIGVTVSGMASPAEVVSLASYAPGIFFVNSSGSGPGVVQIAGL